MIKRRGEGRSGGGWGRVTDDVEILEWERG